jgi:LmbE family N-acetylglucosaminyl deacetylase
MLSSIKRVLVVAAHPDDELLGFGGTISRLCSQGASVSIIILAQGALSRKGTKSDDIDLLKQQSQEAAKKLGANPPTFAEFPDNEMDTISLLSIVREIEKQVEILQPELVLTHHAGDLNIDHRITHEAVITACRPLPGKSVKTILAGETVSVTEWQSMARKPFCPNIFVDIEAYLTQKLGALACYKNEMREPPHPRSFDQIKNLAQIRGRSIGINAAEAFEVVRHLEINE